MGELQERITSAEFVEWMDYIEMEINDFHREDYYLAQIAATISQSVSKNPRAIKLDNYLIKFEMKNPKKKKAEGPVDSKSAWLAFLGVKGGKNESGKCRGAGGSSRI